LSTFVFGSSPLFSTRVSWRVLSRPCHVPRTPFQDSCRNVNSPRFVQQNKVCDSPVSPKSIYPGSWVLPTILAEDSFVQAFDFFLVVILSFLPPVPLAAPLVVLSWWMLVCASPGLGMDFSFLLICERFFLSGGHISRSSLRYYLGPP